MDRSSICSRAPFATRDAERSVALSGLRRLLAVVPPLPAILAELPAILPKLSTRSGRVLARDPQKLIKQRPLPRERGRVSLAQVGLHFPQLSQDFPLPVESAAARHAVAPVVAPVPAVIA